MIYKNKTGFICEIGLIQEKQDLLEHRCGLILLVIT
jgi:hypothetical protein